MIDTHAHIYSPKFSEDRQEMLDRAFEQGVERIYMPNIDLESIDGMLSLADESPEKLFPMMGLHPCDVKEDFQEVLSKMRSWFDRRSFMAVGEIGTDLYWDKTRLAEQSEAFKIQCEWAIELQLPVVIHSRESFTETVALIEEIGSSDLFGVFHCFTGSKEEACKAIDLGFKLGIGGVVTFKNGGLNKVLPAIGLEHLVLETDSPYLAPTPHRGKRNEPSYLSHIAQKLAEVKNVPVEEVVEITSKNALNLFHGRS